MMMIMISVHSLFPLPLISPGLLMCRGTPLVSSDLPATFGKQLVTIEFKKNDAFGHQSHHNHSFSNPAR